ncbi:hypothetical protein RN001_001171 [Aquatica leii]|uniref:Angiotensin-converting enzyme n=1 Tax=Aquatica leii TaxID=1421715 RepID=A0AAN7QA66_9COLE|nr:hypothetical protein RN001_001171 [Aquatica leii]
MDKKIIVSCLIIFLVIHVNVIRSDIDEPFTVQDQIEMYQDKVEHWLRELDMDLREFNKLAASLTWKLATTPDDSTAEHAMELGVARNKWKNQVCASRVRKYWLKPNQKRMLNLLCRGPRFTEELSRLHIEIMGKLAQTYNDELCFTNDDTKTLQNINKHDQNILKVIYPGRCLYGEPDLERLMKRNDLTAKQLKWIWTTWHNFVGPKVKELYPLSIKIQNLAARNNGYEDMGEIWREELEIQNLENEVFNLYEQIKPLYILLHAVIRFKLLQKYGPSVIDPKGPIPIHLLGNMWGQDWSTLIYLFDFGYKKINLQANLDKKNWTVIDMVTAAEDMYTSLGLPRMTDKFWKYSIFQENSNTSVCHGTAANLYDTDDFRMLLCAKLTMEDFYVVHHEMGHIEYYMAYQNQRPMFQEGANSAFHESVGDAIMYGVMVPQHLHRLSLLSDSELFTKSLDHYLLLQQALLKIPEIAFSLIVDKYRWDIFKGKIKPKDYNKKYWELNLKLRGIKPPEFRSEKYFDAGAKFHIPDNTPYIRYFLGGFIQLEIFNSLCKISLCGKIQTENISSSYCPNIPLHRCDIYGSKKVGKKLEEMMKLGSSQHWSYGFQILTGKDYITTKPFLEYYQPIYKLLKYLVKTYNITVGW